MKSTIAAFLMSIPLSAIGLMAVFGIPQMAPGSLFQKGQEDELTRGDYFDDEESEAPRKRKSRGSASRFNEEASAPAFGSDHQHDHDDHDHDSHKSESQPARRSNWSEGNAWASAEESNAAPRKSAGNASRNDGHMASASAFDSIETGPRERVQGRGNLTWKKARDRLTELGVTHFHLESGSTGESFLFICMFSPGDDPRVTRRFEAEATDPLAAVDGVLGQIDTWMQRRFASQSQVGFNR